MDVVTAEDVVVVYDMMTAEVVVVVYDMTAKDVIVVGEAVVPEGASLGRRGGRGRGRAAGRGHGTIPGDGRAAGVTLLPGEWENVEPTNTKFTYSPTPGPNVRFPDNTRPLDLFLMYFTDQVWNLLVTETNRYATLRFLLKSMPEHGLM